MYLQKKINKNKTELLVNFHLNRSQFSPNHCGLDLILVVLSIISISRNKRRQVSAAHRLNPHISQIYLDEKMTVKSKIITQTVC